MLNSNAVHVHGTLGGKGFAHSDGAALLRLVLGFTDEASLLELLEAVADVLASGQSGVLHLDSTAGLATEVLAESLDSSLLSHVQLVADGGGTGVKPVIVEGSELLVASGLNGLGPLLNIILINHWNEKQLIANAHIRDARCPIVNRSLTSGILNLLACFRCWAKALMNSRAGTSFTVFTCLLIRVRCCCMMKNSLDTLGLDLPPFLLDYTIFIK